MQKGVRGRTSARGGADEREQPVGPGRGGRSLLGGGAIAADHREGRGSRFLERRRKGAGPAAGPSGGSRGPALGWAAPQGRPGRPGVWRGPARGAPPPRPGPPRGARPPPARDNPSPSGAASEASAGISLPLSSPGAAGRGRGRARTSPAPRGEGVAPGPARAAGEALSSAGRVARRPARGPLSPASAQLLAAAGRGPTDCLGACWPLDLKPTVIRSLLETRAPGGSEGGSLGE